VGNAVRNHLRLVRSTFLDFSYYVKDGGPFFLCLHPNSGGTPMPRRG
jgi:hypothetical protein